MPCWLWLYCCVAWPAYKPTPQSFIVKIWPKIVGLNISIYLKSKLEVEFYYGATKLETDSRVVKIHFQLKPKLPPFVRNLNSNFDITCIWATGISKRSKISALWNKCGERWWSLYVLPKFNEVWSRNPWELSGESAPPTNWTMKMCWIASNLDVDYLILLKFCTVYTHDTRYAV